jgi:hypothetical protein
MIKPQFLEAIKQMPKVEKIEMIEFALRLVREDMETPEFFDSAHAPLNSPPSTHPPSPQTNGEYRKTVKFTNQVKQWHR